MTRSRILPAAAGLAVLVGAAVMLVALVAAPGSWFAGYVSEAGAAGQRLAGAYRTGLIALALGVGLLGFTRLWPASLLLWVAAVLAGVSGAVSCSGGCPLPPFEPTTVADVVHTAASVVGMAVLAAAMAAVWWRNPQPLERRVAGVATALTVPLGGTLGLTMLFAGRTPLGAALERILLLVAVAWLVTTAALTLVRNYVIVDSWTSKAASPRSSSSSPS
jgi:Protein of unknown function (DUF998)